MVKQAGVLFLAFFVGMLAHATPSLLTTALYSWNHTTEQPTSTGAMRSFLHGPTSTLGDLDVHLTTVKPGITLPSPPPRSKEELLILKEGSVEVLVQGTWQHMEPGSVLFNASLQPHGLRNTGPTTASYYLITWNPKP